MRGGGASGLGARGGGSGGPRGAGAAASRAVAAAAAARGARWTERRGARWPGARALREQGRSQPGQLLPYLGAEIRGAELDAVICGAELFFFLMPRQNLCLPHIGPRRHDPWRRDVIPRRHDSWRRPPGSISAFKFSRGPIVNFFQKKGQIVKNWGSATGGDGGKSDCAL